jgi:inner membrane protein
MLLFGHVGITLAAARINDLVFPLSASDKNYSGFRYKVSSILRKLRDTSGKLDYRMVIIGSMLPDIIDKPLALMFNSSGLFSGRGYAHTLLFSLLLLAGGLIFKKPLLLILFIADFSHLLLDEIWDNPVTLFWPFLGKFKITDTEGWISGIWENLFTLPEVYLPEIIGLVVVTCIAFRVLKDRNIIRFIRQGSLDSGD